MPAKFYETTCKYSKLQVAFNHDDHIKKFLGDVRKEHAALPASSPSTGLADVCSAGLEKNLCSFNSFQWRTVVYNRRNCMAAFHLASYLVPHVGSAQTHVPQVSCELTMASPVHSARLSPNTNCASNSPAALEQSLFGLSERLSLCQNHNIPSQHC